MKPWPTLALSIEQEVLYLTELNPLGFFRNPAADEESCRKLGFQSSLQSVPYLHRKELVEASSYFVLIFRPGDLIYVRGDLVI